VERRNGKAYDLAEKKGVKKIAMSIMRRKGRERKVGNSKSVNRGS